MRYTNSAGYQCFLFPGFAILTRGFLAQLFNEGAPGSCLELDKGLGSESTLSSRGGNDSTFHPEL